jgi:predicted transcriptional regulator
MTERITITIPDSLHTRLQAVKENMNISAVCQQAIEYAVSMEELKMKNLAGKEKVIERLRLERQKSEEEWFNCGRNDGLEAAENLKYEDFEQLCDLYTKKNELERYGDWIGLDQFSEELREGLQEQMDDYSPKPPNKGLYLAGWIEGAIEFWDEIKDEI